MTDTQTATRVWCYGESGHKIYAAQALEALYTLKVLEQAP
jgi:hypothetical protein